MDIAEVLVEELERMKDGFRAPHAPVQKLDGKNRKVEARCLKCGRTYVQSRFDFICCECGSSNFALKGAKTQPKNYDASAKEGLS